MPDEEIWKPVKGFEGCYEVSSLGRVRTVEHRVKNGANKTVTVPARIRKTRIASGAVAVTLIRNKVSYSKTVAKLVAEAFLGEHPPGDSRILHIDGDPLNNAVTNLRYRAAFYLPENKEARELFSEYAERNVLMYIRINHKFLNMGIVDTDDLKQEALLRIWKDIDRYDGKISFVTFCKTKCDESFKKIWRKYGKIKSREISAFTTCGNDPKPVYLIDKLASCENFYERIDANA